MGYRHIDNLYKNQKIMLFKECYATEKIHGTSAHISLRGESSRPRNHTGAIILPSEDEKLTAEELAIKYPDSVSIHFFAGGASHEQFVQLFDQAALVSKFRELGLTNITIYGEAYGGRMQGMSKTYGPTLKFIAFEVEIGGHWLEVPRAEEFCIRFGIEFVPYEKIPCTLEAIDAQRARDSVVAFRNGMGEGHIREGIVLRPIMEFIHQGENGGTIRSKHKRDEFKETSTKREVIEDPAYLKVLQDAQAIADEWVTPMRLAHVLDKVTNKEDLGEVIKGMLEDVYREGKGELVEGKETRSAISKKTVKLYKEQASKKLQETSCNQV